MILKFLRVSYIYKLSERQTKVIANNGLSIKCFLGLAVDERAPHHSPLTTFPRPRQGQARTGLLSSASRKS